MTLDEFLLIVAFLNSLTGFSILIIMIFIKRNYKLEIKKKNEKVSVIIPCKGINDLSNFENQSYRNYEVIVVVDTEVEAEKLKNRYKNFKVVISEKESISGKNSALLTGLKYARGEIVVFADADIKPHKDWLKYLISNLDNNVVTTYRWYFKKPLLSVWNGATAFTLFSKKLNFCWGGSIAINRSLLQELEIEKVWKNEIVDDLTLTKALKERGIEIKFVPQAISESIGEKDEIRWMNRQFFWVRNYYPFSWLVSFLSNFLTKLPNIFGIIYIFINPFVGFMLIYSIFFDFLKGLEEYVTFSEYMNYPKDRFLHPAYHILLRPIVSFIILYNMFSSLFIKEVKWKGKRYKLERYKIHAKID